MTMHSTIRASMNVRPATAALVALILAVGSFATTAVGPGVPGVAAVERPVRLEAGPHTGYRFSSTGTILARMSLTLAFPADVASDGPRIIPTRTGYFLRITSGALAGWDVRESMLAHIPGKAGDIAYRPSATVTFGPGRYLGYAFDATWTLKTTKAGTLSTTATATAVRRAVIDGRPHVLIGTGTWAGYWMPVTAPRSLAAQRITCQVPAKVAAGSAEVLSRVATSDREMALTFDMGGRLTPAVDIMKRLVLDRVCATIFPTGAGAETTVGRAVLALIKAHPQLFELGNHTMNHCNLRDGGGGAACPSSPPSATRIGTELTAAADIYRAQTGREAAPYWRPPYGAHDSRVRTAAAAVGYTKTIMWDIDTIDWRPLENDPPGPTAGGMSDKVVTRAQTGSIVLMHLGGYQTFDALPSLVARLRAANLQPTTISALLR
jgi:peptidoglycan/xylan/chitin deacetylase (PgdA/CDA1 family)